MEKILVILLCLLPFWGFSQNIEIYQLSKYVVKVQGVDNVDRTLVKELSKDLEIDWVQFYPHATYFIGCEDQFSILELYFKIDTYVYREEIQPRQD